jgi:integrase
LYGRKLLTKNWINKMFDRLPTLLVSTPNLLVQAHILAALNSYERAAKGAFSPNTERAYTADTSIFAAWCVARGLSPLPATPNILVAYIDDLAAGNKVTLWRIKGRDKTPKPMLCGSSKPQVIRRYMSSISKMHAAAKLPNPTGAEIVKLALRRLAREKGIHQAQAQAINWPQLQSMVATCGDTLIDFRDRALMLVAYDTLCRRSELVALRVEDLFSAENGMGTALIRRSKTDQEGQGMVRYLARSTMLFLYAWLNNAGIKEGFIFRVIRRGGHIAHVLKSGDVAKIFKLRAMAAGLTASGISGHSTRVGAAQDLSAAGMGLIEIMQAGGWRTTQMVARYTENLEPMRGAMAKLAKIQNRG